MGHFITIKIIINTPAHSALLVAEMRSTITYYSTRPVVSDGMLNFRSRL